MKRYFPARKFLSLIILLLAISACAKHSDNSNSPNSQLSSSEPSNPTSPSPVPPTPEPPPTEEPLPPGDPDYQPLLWESVRAEGPAWSAFVFELIRTEARDLLSAQDMDIFCPRFQSLTEDQKINAAGMLISGIVKFESGFNPLSRYQETTMGTDPVTGLPVWSEGLMQLSYQDIRPYPFCTFDWSQDQNLSPTDPQKTILNPFNNLSCGIRILANQVRRRGEIVIGSGAYWAVIKEGGRYEKTSQIATLVQTLDFCR